MSVELAIKILKENSNVLYGVFGIIETTQYFPPKNFFNQFLEKGNDPCDQDGRMESWKPFNLNDIEYKEIKEWWLSKHPEVTVNSLGASSWNEWQSIILEKED